MRTVLLLRHRAIAELVDYGLHGENNDSKRGECPASVAENHRHAHDSCTTRADAFLRRRSRRSVAAGWLTADGRGVVPDPCADTTPEDETAPAPGSRSAASGSPIVRPSAYRGPVR
jgi:hypothetical protein